ILIAYPLSRVTALSLIADMHYVSDSNASKSKPLANNLSKTDLAILLLTAVPAFLLIPHLIAVFLLAVLILVRTLAKLYLNKHIGGYTGDTLGAVQQVSELVIYALLLAMAPLGIWEAL